VLNFRIQDDLDRAIAAFIDQHDCQLTMEKLSPGMYTFGTKKIHAKLNNNILLIQVGGGYQNMEKFYSTFYEQELEKYYRKNGDEESSPLAKALRKSIRKKARKTRKQVMRESVGGTTGVSTGDSPRRS